MTSLDQKHLNTMDKSRKQVKPASNALKCFLLYYSKKKKKMFYTAVQKFGVGKIS